MFCLGKIPLGWTVLGVVALFSLGAFGMVEEDLNASEEKMRAYIGFLENPTSTPPKIRFKLQLRPEALVIDAELQRRLMGYSKDLCTLVPGSSLVNMIYFLAETHKQGEWVRTIMNTLARYRPPRVSIEVHSYVESLQEEVAGRLDQRLGAVPLIASADVFLQIDGWIHENVLPEKREAAGIAIRNSFVYAREKEFLSMVYTFVEKHHFDKMAAYMAGFVGESLKAYDDDREDPESCRQGVEERVIAALRGIDPGLDLLFRGAETLQTAKVFMAQCNFQEHKQWMELPSKYGSDIKQGLRIAHNQQAPQMLALPFKKEVFQNPPSNKK